MKTNAHILGEKYTQANKVRVQKLFSFGLSQIEICQETGFEYGFVVKTVDASPWLTLTQFDKCEWDKWYDVKDFDVEKMDKSNMPFKIVFDDFYRRFKKLKR